MIMHRHAFNTLFRKPAIRDEIARICGVDDGPQGPIQWVYAQEKCKRGTFGVRVEFLAI